MGGASAKRNVGGGRSCRRQELRRRERDIEERTSSRGRRLGRVLEKALAITKRETIAEEEKKGRRGF